MAPKPHCTHCRIETHAGIVRVRRSWAPKQRCFIVQFDGDVAALQVLLPGWRPRSSKSGRGRAQLTPPVQITSVTGITTFIESLAPKLRETAAAATNPFSASGSSPPATPNYQTLAEAVALVQQEVAVSVRPISSKTYQSQWRSLLSRIPGDTPLIALTRERLQLVVNEMAADGLSGTTIRNLTIALNRVLGRAVDDEVVPRNSLDRVKLPRAVPRPRFVLSREQRDHLLHVAARDGRDIYVLIAIGVFAGLRRSELLNLCWDDIDLRERVLYVRNSMTFSTKSGRDRSVPICQELMTILSKFRRPTGYVIKPLKQRAGPNRWCFDRTFLRVVRAAGFPKLGVHGLRHSMATLGAKAGISEMKIAAWLGHAPSKGSSRVTAGYIHGVGEGFDPDIERGAGG